MTVHANEARIKVLIENPKTPWTKDEQKFLESCDDKKLKSFEVYTPAAPVAPTIVEPTAAPTAAEPAAPAAPTAAEPAAPAAPTAAEGKPLTEEEYLKNAPQSIEILLKIIRLQRRLIVMNTLFS